MPKSHFKDVKKLQIFHILGGVGGVNQHMENSICSNIMHFFYASLNIIHNIREKCYQYDIRAQGARAVRDFNKLHHHGVWGNSLGHFQCTISINRDNFVKLLGEDGGNCMIFCGSHGFLVVTNGNLKKII